MSFSGDGKTLASGSDDKTIKLWNVGSSDIDAPSQSSGADSEDKTTKLYYVNKTGAEILTFTGHTDSVTSVSFSSDGKTLASGSYDKTIKLWSLETIAEIRTLSGHTEAVSSVSFSSNGKTLVSSSGDKTIKLWNVETIAEILTLSGHTSYVTSMSFSDDGKTLASGSGDKTIKLWDVDLDSLMARSCDWVRNYLTHNPNVSESDRHLCDGIGTKK